MCLPTKKQAEEELSPIFLADGSINVNESTVVIPEDINHHVDNAFLNVDINDENAILGFLYESGDGITIVYTSEEAENYCDPFQDNISNSDSEPNPFTDSESDSELETSNLVNSSTGQTSKQNDKDLLWFIEISQQQQIEEDDFFAQDLVETYNFDDFEYFASDSM